MKTTFRLVVVAAALASFEAETKAQPFGTATITPAPTVGAGSITAQGTYTTVGIWTPTGTCKLVAVPMAGGVLSAATVPAPPAGGTWGPLTITNLAVGAYAVYFALALQNGAGGNDYVASAVWVLNVNTPGGPPVPPTASVSYANGDPTVAKGQVSVTNNGA